MMRVFTPEIARQVIDHGLHIDTYDGMEVEGKTTIEQSLSLDYDYCLPEAMQMLVDWKHKFDCVQASFKLIDVDVAEKISQIDCNYLSLPRLELLGVTEARWLSHSTEYILMVGIEAEPDPEVIQGLMNPSHERPLQILLQTLSDENASALASYTHELYLELPFQSLTRSATAILAKYEGYLFQLALPNLGGGEISADETLEILSSLPYKRVQLIHSGNERLYIGVTREEQLDGCDIGSESTAGLE
ncbi:hypothetical protein [Fluviibacter phosphoraccumulans]|nr:hypothetical protein [Fluviibacter phosphoraccumulans]